MNIFHRHKKSQLFSLASNKLQEFRRISLPSPLARADSVVLAFAGEHKKRDEWPRLTIK